MGRKKQLVQRYRPFYLDKPNGRCYWCGKELPLTDEGEISKVLKYCSTKCSDSYYEHYNPNGVRRRLFRERGKLCERCGTDYESERRPPLEIHHKVPVADGGELFPPDDGYEVLCLACHGLRHREINVKKRIARSKERFNQIVMELNNE